MLNLARVIVAVVTFAAWPSGFVLVQEGYHSLYSCSFYPEMPGWIAWGSVVAGTICPPLITISGLLGLHWIRQSRRVRVTRWSHHA